MADTLEKELIKEICSSGDKTGTIPETTSAGSNSLSYADGFPIVTSTPQSDGGIPPKRTDMNKVLNLLSKNLVFLQNGGSISFDSDIATGIGGYPKGARVLYDDKAGNKYYIESLKDNNSTEPTEENIYKAPITFTGVAGVVSTTDNLPTASADTTSDRYLCLADSLVYITSANHSTTPTTYSWAGFSLGNTFLDKSTSSFYVKNEGQVVSVASLYDWVAYNTQTKPTIMGITAYALSHLTTRTKDIIQHTTKPTLIICGDTTTHSGWNFELLVSTDQTNWVSVNRYQVQTGDPDSSPIFSTIIDGGLYWKFTCSINSYVLKSASLY